MAVMGYRSPDHPMAEALDMIASALDGAADVACWSLSDEQLADLVKQSHGLEAQLVLTMSLDKFQQGVGSGLLDTGERLSPETVRKLACDAQVIPALLDTEGQPLDLGRSARTFTPAQRRALGLRDGSGCAFPGCDRPLVWCEGHHIRYWINGGLTDLDNGVLLCCYHHTTIHLGDWVVQVAADGRPVFIPPTWIDPEQKPLRNTVHLLG